MLSSVKRPNFQKKMTSQQMCTFQEFCQRISKLKLPVGWSINISEFAYIKKSDDIHDLSHFEIIVDLNLAFKIRIFALFFPPDHDIYITYKN